MNELRLDGCRPEPLGSYLKGLGILRLLGEQYDPATTGHWKGDRFALTTNLGRGELLTFFVDEYQPTPLVAPWNGGSGFETGGKSRTAEHALRLVEASAIPRLEPYRRAIRAARQVYAESGSLDKRAMVERCRAQLPDDAVGWVDAAAVLTDEAIGYPPLLGSGGNLGRLELSANFMQRLADVLGLRTGRSAPDRDRSVGWLGASLFADRTAHLVEGPIGQFDPGSAGGVNSSPTGAAESLVNPWDYVLLLEGSLLFASAAARRLGFDGRGKTAMPFMVDASPVGYASGTGGESSRGEVWAPLWSRAATASEIAQLIGEGRSEWRGRQSRTGLDMARAVATLGVDRGVDAFARHAFVERHGQSTLAVPVGRITVHARPEVPLLAELDRWLDGIRRGSNPPASVARLLRRVDSAMFQLADQGGPAHLQEVLVAVAGVEAAAGRSRGFLDRARIRPVQHLRAADWLPRLDDGSPELRLAASLASQHDDDGACLRWLLRPVRQPHAQSRVLEWSEGPTAVRGFGTRPLMDVLAAALVRRSITGNARPSSEDEGSTEHDGQPEMTGVRTAFRRRVATPLPDVAAFVSGELDDGRLARLLAALLLLDWRWPPVDVRAWFQLGPTGPVAPPAWAALAPFFHGRPIKLDDGEKVSLLPQATWPIRLQSDRAGVIREALTRLRIARLDPAVSDAGAIAINGPNGTRLAAALMCPIPDTGASRLLRRIVPSQID